MQELDQRSAGSNWIGGNCVLAMMRGLSDACGVSSWPEDCWWTCAPATMRDFAVCCLRWLRGVLSLSQCIDTDARLEFVDTFLSDRFTSSHSLVTFVPILVHNLIA